MAGSIIDQTPLTRTLPGNFGRNVLCAMAACLLTVVLLGEVGKSPAQAAQRAAAEQSSGEFVGG